MAAFPLPAGHPYASVRPGYAGFETSPAGSVINATASYVGASGDYPANAITLQLFATQGGTWTVGTPGGLTVQTTPALNQAYTAAVYTGGLRGQTYTFTSISLTPAQGATLGWTGTAPSVTLTIPTNTTTIASGYYVGGNAGGIYLTPVLDSTLTPIVQGITDYFFVCTTSAAYASVDSIGTAVIPFPTGTTFTAGTTTSLNFTVQCRSNGILGAQSVPFIVGIVQPAVPSLTGVLSGNNVNLTFSSTTPGCTFDLSYSGAVTATGITSPYSYTTTAPGAYTFQVRASLCGLTTFSLPSTTTILPAQPTGVSTTVSGLSITLAWTGLGAGYTYNVSGTGLATQTVSVPTAQFTNLGVGSTTFYIQSIYAGISSTSSNVQVSINTTPPYNFGAASTGSTITLSWANDTPGATFTLSSSSPSTLATQNGLTAPNYIYTGVPGGVYSFTVFSTSASIQSAPATVGGIVGLTAPYNFGVTTLSDVATLNWQEATTGASFNISYLVGTTLSSKAVAVGATTTTISGLPVGNYTFGLQSIVSGASSSFTLCSATVVAAPTNFKAISVGTTISLSWIESTAGCSFTVTTPALGTKTTVASNIQYTGATAGSSYIFTLTPSNTSAFVGQSVTATGVVLSTPVPTAVLSGLNINLSWPAVTGTGMTYTVSSSPGVPSPPTQPGTALSVSFVSPPPGAYIFSVIASDSAGNVSVKGTTGSLTVPVPQPINVGATMSASSQIAVTWTETLPGCTFTFTGAPATTANSITNTGTTYTGVFNNPPSTTGYTSLAVVAASGGVSSIASTAVSVYTFAPFNLTLSAACSQTGSTNNVTAAYSMSSPAAIYGAGTNGTSPYVANVAYSGLSLTPSITLGTAGLGGDYGSGFWASGNSIINAVPATFPVTLVVPPTALTVTANGTNLLVKWTDSTTAGCRYTVSGTPGTFTCNVSSGTGSTGVTFTNATIGTSYTFIVTASSTGTYTASRQYASAAGGLVTTENATIPYTITSVSVPSTAVTPLAYPATFTATATGTTIAINWSTVSGATGYTVYNSGTSLFTTTTATSCNYVGSAGTTYTLTVQANGASVSNTSPTAITVTPLAAPVISSIAQSGSNITVTSTGTGLSINTPTGLSAPTGTSTFNFTGGSGNTQYSFTVTATGTGATSTATSAFTTLGTPVITSATAQGTATITVNWTYAGPDVSGFTVYSNTVSTATVGPTIRTAIFAQSATTNNADTVYVVANGTVGSSIQSASVSVSDLVTAPTLTSSTVNGLGFTVQWTYSTTAGVRTLSDFQVCNSTRTTLYSTVPYVANQLNYNSLFNVPSIAAYSFVVVGRDSVGSTISSAASTSVTPVAAPTITSVVQTGGTITLAATGSALSTPTVTPATLSTVSTGSPWAFTGAAGNTSYTFSITSTGTNATSTPATSNITTLATPLAPTLSASGTTITVTWPAAGAYNIYSNTSLVTPATSNTTNATITSGITTGTTYTYTIALSSAGYTSLPSPSASITPVAAPSITSTLQNDTTITVTCATPATGVTLSIPNAPTPNRLTAGATTATTFKYTGYLPGTQFTFVVQSKNGNASNTASSTITPLYTPVMAYTSGTGTNLTLVWYYTGSVTGVTFVLKDVNNNWSGTSVTGASTAPFTTGVFGTPYSIYVYATSGGNQTPNSGTLNFTPIGVTTFTQDYQLTTQTQIVGNAYASSALYYNITTDSLNKLVPSNGSPLIWTGATPANTYTGVYVQGTDGVSVSTAIGVTLYSAFSPTLISGCQVWYDGADPLRTGIPPGDGDNIYIWYNKGVGGNAYNARRVTGYSAASYSEVDRALSFNTSPITLYNTSYGVSPTTETIFIVFKVTAPSSTNNTLIGGLVSGGRGFGCGYTGGGAGTIGYLNMVNEWQSYVSGYTSGATAIATGQLVGGKTAVSLNGVALTTPTTYAAYTGVGTTHLGAQITSGNTYSYNGLAMEIIIYNAALTTIQIQLVQRYLAWKWGLQTKLPTTFPLNNFPGTLPLPNTFPGLSLWLDAADTTTITKSGVNLGSIADKSGNNNPWTAGGTTATTFDTIGGFQCIKFTGYSTSFITGTYTLAQGQNLTMFLAFNSVDSTQVDLFTNGPSIIFNSGGTLQLVNKTNYTLNYSSTVNIPASANKTYVVAVTSTITNSTTASSFSIVNGTVYTMNANGNNYVASGTSTFTASTIAYNPWSLGEVIVYSGVLANAQIQQVAGYLIYKWKAY